MTKTHTNGSLTVEVTESPEAVTIIWLGKSISRKPSTFLTPILTDALSTATQAEKTVVIDFRKLQYMNSSSITPVIKILERAKRGTVPVRILYDQSQRWQDLSFSALEIFETRDNRIEIRGTA